MAICSYCHGMRVVKITVDGTEVVCPECQGQGIEYCCGGAKGECEDDVPGLSGGEEAD